MKLPSYVYIRILCSVALVSGFDPEDCRSTFTVDDCTFTFSETLLKYESSSERCSVSGVSTAVGHLWLIERTWNERKQSTQPDVCPEDTEWESCSEDNQSESCDLVDNAVQTRGDFLQTNAVGREMEEEEDSTAGSGRVLFDPTSENLDTPKDGDSENLNSFCREKLGMKISYDSCLIMSSTGVVVFALLILFLGSKFAGYVRGNKKVNMNEAMEKAIEYAPKQLDVEALGIFPGYSLSNAIELEEIRNKISDQSFIIILQREFATISKNANNIKVTFRAGNRDENSRRNLDLDLLPYDQNRVTLKNEGIDSTNDYINASWISNLKMEREMIVTGVPVDEKPETLLVFWQMVLEYNAKSIILILDGDKERIRSTLFPKGIGIGLCLDLMNKDLLAMSVILTEEKEISPNILQRNIMIRAKSKTMEVVHYQITIVPNFNDQSSVQSFVGSILETWKLIKQHGSASDSVIVHDELGVRYSAAYLAIAYLIKEEEMKKEVNIPKAVMSLRKDRMNMVPTFNDYLYLYMAMAVYYEMKKTVDGKNNLAIAVENMTEMKRRGSRLVSRIKSYYNRDDGADDFKRLEEIKNEEEEEEDLKKAGKLEENRIWNRDQEILPFDNNRIVLETSADFQGDYINASSVSIEDFYVPSAIVAQGPASDIPGSIDQFWRMVLQTQASCIIQLIFKDKDPRMADYLPKDRDIIIGDTVISTLSNDEVYGGFCTSRVYIEKDEEERMVDHVKMNYWPAYKFKRNKEAVEFLETIQEIWEHIPKAGPVIIHCDNGVKNSGIFLALSILLYQKKLKELNVYGVVEELRKQRDKMVPEQEDFQFIFNIIRSYRLK